MRNFIVMYIVIFFKILSFRLCRISLQALCLEKIYKQSSVTLKNSLLYIRGCVYLYFTKNKAYRLVYVVKLLKNDNILKIQFNDNYNLEWKLPKTSRTILLF